MLWLKKAYNQLFRKLNIIVRYFKVTPVLITLLIASAEIAISFNSVLLPDIKQSFSVSEATAQSTVSIGLFALGFFGMLYGAISDCVGRRPMFLVSIAIFTVASLACTLANNIYVFLFARLLQGAGSGASWIVGNACLKDIYTGSAYTRVMNNIHAVAGILPAIAPVIGSKIASMTSWQACFLLLFILGLSTWCGIFFLQPETLKNKKQLSAGLLVNEYQNLAKNVTFLCYLAIKVFCVMIMFVDTSNTSLIFIEHLGVAQVDFGYYVLPAFSAYVISTFTASACSGKVHINTLIGFGLICMLVSQLLLLISPLMWQQNAVIVQGIKCLMYFGLGFIFGNATAMIVSSAKDTPGSASAVMIGLEMLFSSLGIMSLAIYFDGSILPLTYFTGVWTLVCLMILGWFHFFCNAGGTGS